jgi:hypothetical protein
MSVAFLMLLPQLISAGVASVAQIKALVTSFHPGMTDAELDAVCGLIHTQATTQQNIAKSDLLPNV